VRPRYSLTATRISRQASISSINSPSEPMSTGRTGRSESRRSGARPLCAASAAMSGISWASAMASS